MVNHVYFYIMARKINNDIENRMEQLAKLVIINQGNTPFDRYAHLRFYEKIGDVLPQAVKRLKILIRLG